MDDERMGGGNYVRFFAMILTSMVLMYLLTYLNSYDILGHAWFSETRLFMVLIMGSVMMVVMFLFMRKNYRNRRLNAGVLVGAALMFAAGLWLVRSQVTVNDVDYMEGMIPHHSIAILTSERAGIRDMRVAELAGEIIEAQRREIREMEWLIADIRDNGPALSREDLEKRPVPEFQDPY